MTYTQRLRTVGIGAACFLIASVGVRAETSLPVGLPQGLIRGIADANDASRTARVTSTGDLATRDQATLDRLDLVNAKLQPLAYTSDGLRVSATGSVTVTNLPQTQQIAGTVTVANLPTSQTVSGAVTVSNLPAVQPVSGTVTVANLADSSMAPTSGAIADLRFDLRALDLQDEASWVAGCNAGACPASNRFVNLFPTHAPPQLVTLLALNTPKDVHLTCRLNKRVMFTVATSTNMSREFVHPLQVDECWIECVSLAITFPDTEPKCIGIVTMAGLTSLPPQGTGSAAPGINQP